MTTKDEALKLALDALEELNNTSSYWWQEVDKATIKKIDPAITAIKQALAAPVQPAADALIRQYIEGLLANNQDEASNATKAMVDYVYATPPTGEKP
jgi:hypothetical protein